ncbi:hypothetical protein KIPB_014065, partial [Kipferlia bialata]
LLSNVADKAFSIVYVNLVEPSSDPNKAKEGGHGNGKPDFKWLRTTLGLLPPKLMANLTSIYVVAPTMLIKTGIRLYLPNAEAVYLTSPSDIFNHVTRSQACLPEFVWALPDSN